MVLNIKLLYAAIKLEFIDHSEYLEYKLYVYKLFIFHKQYGKIIYRFCISRIHVYFLCLADFLRT